MDQRNRYAGGLLHHQPGGRGELVGARDDGSLQNVAIAIERASAVLKRLHAGDTDGDIHQSFAPRPAETIGDEQGSTVQPVPQRVGRCVGIGGENGREVLAGHVGLI